jgi:uncharacterized protein YyaL (SSP411 family)
MHLALLNAVDLRSARPKSSSPAPTARRELAAAAKLSFLDRIVLRATSADVLPAAHPAQAKIAATTDAAAFVCVGATCSLPVADPTQLAAAVKSMRG